MVRLGKSTSAFTRKALILAHVLSMKMSPPYDIRRVLAFGPVHITVRWILYPPHWRPSQRLAGAPTSFGYGLRQQRLEFHLLQGDLAKGLGVSIVAVSNWRCGNFYAVAQDDEEDSGIPRLRTQMKFLPPTGEGLR
jgi:hypothetical protein